MGSQNDRVGDKHDEHQDKTERQRDDFCDGQHADGGDEDGNGAAEDHDPAVQGDPAGDHRTETEQRGQVEHIRAEDHTGANRLLVLEQRS